jgi:hypothetical protein
MNGSLMAVAICSLTAANVGFSHWYPLIYFPFLFVGECVDWWIPYFSPSFAKARKIWDYDSRYSRTIKWIRHVPGRRTPDANHTTLHFITLIAWVFVLLDRLS